MRCLTFFDTNRFVWIFAFALSRFNLAFTQCFYPDGLIATDYQWVPCTGAKYSACCIPSEGDICQDNGLCYYPDNEQLYRGTCTDPTWNDPSCPSSICVTELRLTLLGETGFETTWDWVVQCDGSGSSSFACGAILDGQQQQATCAGSATTATASIQTATLASTFESATAIAVDASTAFGAAATDPASLSTSIPGSGTKRVVLTVGLIVAIIVGPTLALIIGIGIFIFLRKRSSKKYAAIRLNSAPHPPPNGPVGADQVNPYEMGFDESVSPHPKYEYSSAKVDAFEVSGGTAVLTGEKKWDGVPEMGGDEQNVLRSPRSPAPMYSETMMPVELDGTSSFGGRYGR